MDHRPVRAAATERADVTAAAHTDFAQLCKENHLCEQVSTGIVSVNYKYLLGSIDHYRKQAEVNKTNSYQYEAQHVDTLESLRVTELKQATTEEIQRQLVKKLDWLEVRSAHYLTYAAELQRQVAHLTQFQSRGAPEYVSTIEDLGGTVPDQTRARFASITPLLDEDNLDGVEQLARGDFGPYAEDLDAWVR